MLQAVFAPSGEFRPVAQNCAIARDNLWILGGEIISKLHEDPRLRKRPTDQIVLAVLDDEGGPLVSHGSEDQQRSFDSTCRKFFRFVKERNTGGQ
jgi:hypothetical protein